MSLLERVYDERLRTHAESLGIHRRLSAIYARARAERKRIRKWFFGDRPRLEVHIRHLLSRDRSITHDVNGVTLEFPIETYWQYKRFRWMHAERELFEELTEELSSGDVFYDVGAHLGWHTVVAANVDERIDIVAFEPHPVTAARFEEVVEYTGHDAEIHQVALYDQEETFEITNRPLSGAGIAGSRRGETVEIPAIDGDSLIREGEIRPPDVLKIDAEGAEAAVLRGLQETIRSHEPRLIYCEIHGDDGEAERLLDDLGYECEPFDTGRPIVRATPK